MEITAKTKIYDLLQEYPALEERIMNIAPPFKNLHNPVLRRTVGKLANLEKAAQIGGIDVLVFVNTLRLAVGQPALRAGNEFRQVLSESDPAWIKGTPAHVIDGVELLNRGEHPLNSVNTLMHSLQPQAFLVLYTNFKPLPLIEAMEKQNYRVHYKIDEQNPARHLTFIGKV